MGPSRLKPVLLVVFFLMSLSSAASDGSQLTNTNPPAFIAKSSCDCPERADTSQVKQLRQAGELYGPETINRQVEKLEQSVADIAGLLKRSQSTNGNRVPT